MQLRLGDIDSIAELIVRVKCSYIIFTPTYDGRNASILLSTTQSTHNLVVMQFYKLAIGARFEFRGRQFTEVALSMAEDE
jgi:hypothetical protein